MVTPDDASVRYSTVDSLSSMPPLPKSIQGLAGVIEIKRPGIVPGAGPKETLLGLWVPETRTIFVRGTLRRVVAWQTLLHELGHAALSDAEIVMSVRKEESLVGAFAAGMMHVVHHFVSGNQQSSTKKAGEK